MFARDLEHRLGLRITFDPPDSKRGKNVYAGAGTALLSTGQRWMWNSPELRSEYTFMRPFGATKFGPTGPFAKMMDDLGVGRRILPEPLIGFSDRYFLELFPGVSAKEAFRKSRGMAAHMNGQIGEWHGAADDAQRFGGTAMTNQKFSSEDGVSLREVDAVRVPSLFYRLFNENVIYNRDYKRVLKLGGADAEEQLRVYAETKAIPTWMAKRHGISGPVSDDGRTVWIDGEGVAKIKSVGSVGGILRRLGEAGIIFDAGMTGWRAYQLYAQGNTFAAESEWRHFAARNSIGILGGMSAGALYGALFGSGTGPGALLFSAVGAIGGAFGGDALAKAYDKYKVNHGVGTDGKTYTYTHGQWVSYEPELSPSRNSDGDPVWEMVKKLAPADQVPGLDFHRAEKVAEVALNNPEVLDPEHLSLDGKDWELRHNGRSRDSVWTHIIHAGRMSKAELADVATSAKLNEMAQHATWRNENYSEILARQYLQTFYKNHWDKIGSLREEVTKALHLPSEQHIVDPKTGLVWDAQGDYKFTRIATGSYPSVPHQESADFAATRRLMAERQAVKAANASYAGFVETHDVAYGHAGVATEGNFTPYSTAYSGSMMAAAPVLLTNSDLVPQPIAATPSLGAPSGDTAASSVHKVKTTVHLYMDGQKFHTQEFEHDL